MVDNRLIPIKDESSLAFNELFDRLGTLDLYIDIMVPKFKEKLNIKENKKFAILVRNNFNGNLIHKNLKTPNKHFKDTVLDSSSELWARIFTDTLFYIFDENEMIDAFLEKWNIYEIAQNTKNSIISKLLKLKNTNIEDLKSEILTFEEISKLLYPNNKSISTINSLQKILENPDDLRSYIPVKDDELQIMTLHKSKGLEFDVIFHLDLYSYIIPSFGAYDNVTQWNEDLNLHYVGITRAKQVCFLLSSTQRLRPDKPALNAKVSEFLSLNNLEEYRHNYK